MDNSAEEVPEKLLEENLAGFAGTDDEAFLKGLTTIYKQLRFGRNLKKAMKLVENNLLELLDTRLITIYQSVSNGKHIVATFKGGGKGDNDNIEIKAPFSPTSLAGYVALSQRPILVNDVYNKEELTSIHPRLQWDNTYSESQGMEFKSMIVVPIKDGILLGVLQLIRLKEDEDFNQTDLKHAAMLAQMLAKQFRAELQSTQGPFDYLVQQGKISS
jgi:GAF domain-containing protein